MAVEGTDAAIQIFLERQKRRLLNSYADDRQDERMKSTDEAQT